MTDDGLSEDDVSVKFITPAIVKAGWDDRNTTASSPKSTN